MGHGCILPGDCTEVLYFLITSMVGRLADHFFFLNRSKQKTYSGCWWN